MRAAAAAAATLLPEEQLNSRGEAKITLRPDFLLLQADPLQAAARKSKRYAIQQSILYKEHKRQSRHQLRGAQPSTSQKPRHAEAGSKTHVRQSVLYSERKRQPRHERGGTQPPTLLTASEHDSTTVEPSRLKEASPSLSDELRELEEYRKTHTFSSFEDAIHYVLSVHPRTLSGLPVTEDDHHDGEAFELTTPAQSVPVQVPTSEASVDVVQNGNKWMGEEVMTAFEKYVEERDYLKGIEYKLDELCHQCLNVKNYNHIFHHFNFSVKTKTPGSTDWTSELYFAEVKTMFRQKVYFCWPLEPNENGHCNACKNQGMDDLKHPVIGAFDRGDNDTMFPYMYIGDDTACPYFWLSESDDEFPNRVLDDSDDDDII
ncbi:hypothetical protein OsI_07074 [Oryza sativa Indica Group]|uniref:DUF3615 domain-containing protein n=1 Tax=Oryza sativa subsp. indica TaxID=39946 RepID=B8AH52_ORYSI|nr:hypothetical protein OsI_07074 [Oryza sativa Indica Group]